MGGALRTEQHAEAHFAGNCLSSVRVVLRTEQHAAQVHLAGGIMSSTWVVRGAWGSMQTKPHLPTLSSSSRTLRALRMNRIWVLSVPFSLGHAHSVSQTGRPYLCASHPVAPVQG